MKFKIWFEHNIPVKIIEPKENIYELMDANFWHGIIVGKYVVNTNSLRGGIRTTDSREQQRVQQLAEKISSPQGYFERIVVDEENDVIEGQHRFEAAKLLKWPQIPILKVADLGRVYGYEVMQQAVNKAKTIPLHPEQINQIVRYAMDAIYQSGSKEKAITDYEMPSQLMLLFQAAINAANVRDKK